MRAEVQKIFNLYEELVEAGNNATLMFSSLGGKSTIKLQLESPITISSFDSNFNHLATSSWASPPSPRCCCKGSSSTASSRSPGFPC